MESDHDYKRIAEIILNELSKMEIEGSTPPEKATKPEVSSTFIPDLMRHLNKKVISQSAAKKAIIGTLYKYLKHDVRQPLLLIGGTGCGKTHLIRTAMKWVENNMPDVHFISRNVSRITPSGWSGDNFDEVLRTTMVPGHRYIIHLDEIDKLMQPQHDSNGEDLNASTCAQLMNAISGEDHQLAGIDWSQVLVICTGAFEWLEEERKRAAIEGKAPVGFGTEARQSALSERELMERAGVIKELLGRFACITHLEPLTEQAMMDILCLPAKDGGLLEAEMDLYKKEGIEIILDSGARERIARRAARDKHGARSIQTVLHELLGPGVLVDLKLTGRKTYKITGREGEHGRHVCVLGR